MHSILFTCDGWFALYDRGPTSPADYQGMTHDGRLKIDGGLCEAFDGPFEFQAQAIMAGMKHDADERDER